MWVLNRLDLELKLVILELGFFVFLDLFYLCWFYSLVMYFFGFGIVDKSVLLGDLFFFKIFKSFINDVFIFMVVFKIFLGL